ncbi:MAG: cysteine--tRNA ligase [Emcibacteraceae bacterium]|jgi:cysteinyl-tRNA synthetase|nr:cysteine--tRNA ligase [Emcibacteraceae bacterium]MDC0111859.1 cysteine--tRNA ligase [Emcibacteraceae bacterium]|tara:strand:- start:10148 stop:11473 length:1326 start_codon:yes stop_codon:yes gene_type:complete
MSSKLKLYNTLTNKKEEFKAINPSHITMYVCGPTVYDFAHVGNARPVVVFDTLARLLRHDYGKVTYARNITDIDDKIIAAAANGNIAEITEKFARHYEEDMSALNAEKPDIVPKATDYLDEMIVLISDLIAKGYAYEANDHVLFQVSKMDDYGELSGRKVEDLLAGARVDIAGYKREASDFVLWKPSSDAQPGWESPWGRGRPGWHTECSAMIKKNFGETIDIHGGGQDLIFPHHENEIAQSKCAHGGRNLANYWLHNGYLTVSGEKMSKSQGNFVTVHDLLKEFIGGGEDIRLCLLTAQYRQPVDFSRDGVIQAKKQLDKWYKITQGVEPTVVSDAVLDALRDDLNTPKAIMALNQLSKNENRKGELLASAQLLGLLESTIEKRLMGSLKINPEKIEDKILERTIAKMDKNWKRADEIRDELNKSGIKLLDRPDGTTAWE